jgi:hypothetical protein
MFFTLCPHADIRLPYHDPIGNMVLSHDAGWTNLSTDVWTKGYRHKNIAHGNFVEISKTNDQILVYTGTSRSFPLWWNEGSQTLTNLDRTGSQIFADRTPKIGAQSEFVFRDITGVVDTSEITADHAVELIVDNLCAKAQALLTDYADLPRRLFVTGGIDTVTLFALMRNQNINFELLNYNHFEFDNFLNHQYPLLKENYWAYQRIHHWQESCMLLTGGSGDEFLMRGPATLAIWAAWHGVDIIEIINSKPGYHIDYFNKTSTRQLFEDQNTSSVRAQYSTKQDLTKAIIDMNLNDHQYWHLGNTLTWTPFADAELTKIMLRLNIDDMLSQIVDATISRRVIERLYAPAGKLISDRKNVGTRKKLHLLSGI